MSQIQKEQKANITKLFGSDDRFDEIREFVESEPLSEELTMAENEELNKKLEQRIEIKRRTGRISRDQEIALSILHTLLRSFGTEESIGKLIGLVTSIPKSG